MHCFCQKSFSVKTLTTLLPKKNGLLSIPNFTKIDKLKNPTDIVQWRRIILFGTMRECVTIVELKYKSEGVNSDAYYTLKTVNTKAKSTTMLCLENAALAITRNLVNDLDCTTKDYVKS